MGVQSWIKVTTNANIRGGAPAISATVVRQAQPGTLLLATGTVNGDLVQGNANWYGLEGDSFIWSGACIAADPPLFDLSRTPMVIDLDWYDRVTDFQAAKGAGVVGIIHKATTGISGTTENYVERRDAAKAAGLLWGCYHWGTGKPVSAQLDNFLNYAKPQPDELIALDFEPTPGDQMTMQQCRDFCQGMHDRLGRWPVLYSSGLITDPVGGLGSAKDPFFADIRLWLAAYTTTPKVPPSWAKFWLWQYTDGSCSGSGICSHVAGIPGNDTGDLDCNYYDGTAAELTAQWAN